MRRFAVSLSDGREIIVEANSPEEARSQVEAQLSAEQPTEDVAGAAALRGAEAIGEQPAFGRGIRIPTGVFGAEAELPFSLAQVSEALPAIGGTLGSLLGRTPATAGLGSAAGEVARQGIRTAAGYVPAPGMAQEALGLDPSSPEAIATGIAAETAGGVVPEAVSNWLRRLAPGVREAGLRQYATLLEPKGEKELVKATEKLKPIQEELPMLWPITGRRRMEKVAEKKAVEAGKEVGKLYNVETPSSFKPVIEELRAASRKNVRYPEHVVPIYDELGNVIDTETLSASFKDPKLAKAYQKRIDAMREAERLGKSYKGAPSIQDLFEARQTADELAKRAKSTVFERQAKELAPEVRALKTERTGLTKALHAQTKAPPGQLGGEEADAIFSAWKSLETAGKKKDAGTFLQRWALSRLIAGPVGTVAGAVSTQPAFWRSLSAKGLRGLASALEANDKAAFSQMLRAALADYERAERQ